MISPLDDIYQTDKDYPSYKECTRRSGGGWKDYGFSFGSRSEGIDYDEEVEEIIRNLT